MVTLKLLRLFIVWGLPLMGECWLFAWELPSEQITCYVSTVGSDGWSGKLAEPNATKTDGPFATLQRARGEMRKAGRESTRKVVVRGGTYFLNETLALGSDDSGTPRSPMVWQAAPGEEVRLVGGLRLPPEAFRPLSEAGAAARLDATARGKVVQVDLAPFGIAVSDAFPARFRGPPPVPELFFDDQRMTLARWPNEGWTTIARIIDSGSTPREGDNAGRPGVFEYSGDRPHRWNADAGVWLHGYWCFDWYEEVIKVRSIDLQKRQITLAEPHLYSVRQGNPSPRRYRAINVLEELDQPGEYYVDRRARRLYFWPPAELAGSRILLATLTTPVLALREVSHVVLRGFIVEASQGDGIELSGGTGNRILACKVRNVRQLGIRVGGGNGHRVEACDIHDTGTGGLVLAGGDCKTLTPAGHEAVNNHICRFSHHQLTYANAILLEGVGNRAAHNLIHDSPVYFDDGDGGDTVFGNVFFRCGDPGRGSFGTVFSHGGHDNLAENNVFIECKRALGSAPWDDQRWRRAIEGGEDCEWQTRLLKEVGITKPPFTTRYPSLVGFMNPKPGQARVNRAVRNVIVMCADVRSGNWQVDPAENWMTDRDPGFVDAGKGDFRLRPDAEVFVKLPGFQAIPFEKIGLYADELRPRPPVETWSYGPPKPQPPLSK